MRIRIYNKTLNPAFWDDRKVLKPEIRIILLKIAKTFYTDVNLNAHIRDMLFIGSNSNYNWTPSSDVDLHILIDFNDIPMTSELAKEYTKTIAKKWNEENDVHILNHNVEIYIQDVSEENRSTGVYSLLTDKWIKEAIPQNIVLDRNLIQQKYTTWVDKINKTIKENNPTKLKKVLDDLVKMRESGLTAAGEFSTENIVFKILRQRGILGKIKSSIQNQKNKQLSLREDYSRSGSADEDFFERYNKNLYELGSLLKQSGGKGSVPWKKIPAAKLKRIWLDFGNSKVVRDEKGMEYIVDLMLNNIVRLRVSTEMMGHTEHNVRPDLEEMGFQFTNEEWDDWMSDWMVDKKYGNWMISDFGLPKLEKIYTEIYNADSAETQLYAVDKALNVIHQRSDLANMFVEGGSSTLLSIANQGGYTSSDDLVNDGFDPSGSGPNPDRAMGDPDLDFYNRNNNLMRKLEESINKLTDDTIKNIKNSTFLLFESTDNLQLWMDFDGNFINCSTTGHGKSGEKILIDNYGIELERYKNIYEEMGKLGWVRVAKGWDSFGEMSLEYNTNSTKDVSTKQLSFLKELAKEIGAVNVINNKNNSKVRINESNTPKENPSIVSDKWWISPDGELYKCSGHPYGALEIVDKLNLKQEKDDVPYQTLFRLGWARVVSQHDGYFVNNPKKPISNIQIRVLKDMAIEDHKPLINSDTNKIIISPLDTLEELTNSEFLLYHDAGEKFDDFKTPTPKSVSNSRSIFGHFFTTELPKKGNIAGAKYVKMVDGSELKLFDWGAYGNGSWEQFSTNKFDKNFEWKIQSVLEWKKTLLKKGYDGIVVHEIGIGNTVVVFDESKQKLKNVNSNINELTMDYDSAPVKDEHSGEWKKLYNFSVGEITYQIAFLRATDDGDLDDINTFYQIRSKTLTRKIEEFLNDYSFYITSFYQIEYPDTPGREKARFPVKTHILTNKSKYESVKVYSQVLKAIKYFLDINKPDFIAFVPAESRQCQIYDKFINKFVSKLNYKKLDKEPILNTPIRSDEFIFVRNGLGF